MISTKMLHSLRMNSFTCIIRRSALNRRVSTSSTYKTEAMAIPAADGQDKIYPEKLESIVSQISSLTLLEVADLNALLKKRLNIPDAAPMAMAMAPAQAAEDDDDGPKLAEAKTSFNVKLTAVDPAKKIAIIKFIKGCVEGMNLVQAKKFVESLPAVVKGDLGKDEAEKLKQELAAAGAEAVIE